MGAGPSCYSCSTWHLTKVLFTVSQSSKTEYIQGSLNLPNSPSERALRTWREVVVLGKIGDIRLDCRRGGKGDSCGRVTVCREDLEEG